MARQREPSRDPRSVLQEHRAARLGERQDVHRAEGERPHLHVPNELLVGRDDLPLVERDLRELGAQELPVPASLEARLLRFEVPAGEPLTELVGRLRSRGDDRAARVGPHHVFSGLPYIQGGPAGFPTAADERLEFSPGDGAGVHVAVLDTGFTPKLHRWLDAHVEAAPDTLEQTDAHPHNGWLDDQAGHGTFIAGLILERAPQATVQVTKVLDSEGYGSELAVARAIVEQANTADIINLSLGCYSHDDLPPLALAEALRHVAPTTAVVAAAGNDSTHRPLWPAAHKRAIAVGAVDGSLRRANFSNFGWWVDAATPGVDVLSTFLDFDETGRTAVARGRVPQVFRGWARWSGTSFAAPRLVGAIAATMTRGGFASAREAAVAVLASSSRPVDPELGIILDI
jgi:subtilisin family serine protease